MKFGGIGLKHMVVCAIFTMILIVILKTVLTKYPVKGASEFVQAV